MQKLTATVKQAAIELGFDAVGITDASPLAREAEMRLREWLAAGHAAGMLYMQRNLERRLRPAGLLDGARSIICAAVNYKPPSDDHKAPAGAGRIAEYATFRDYHAFMKERLLALAAIIRGEAGQGFSFRVCVDSSAVAERSLAARAGLGFIGRNSMLIVPGLGPAVFLGELVTNLELQPDAPISERCRQCNACAEACPTAALGPDGLNARRCISYLTTEYKGHIPPQLACKAGDRLFGCDDCVRACPFYAEAPCCSEATLSLRTGPGHLNPAEVLEWDEATFKNRTAGTPLERPGLQVLKRNAAICTNNSRQR